MRSLSLAAVLGLSLVAHADITLVNQLTSGGKTRLVTLSEKPGFAFFQVEEEGQPPRTMLRDQKGKKLFIVDHTKKRIIELTEEDSKAMEARQEQFKQQLRAQLDKMPPAQRARVEETMLGGHEGKPAKYEFKKLGKPARKVNGFSCTDYTVLRDGKPMGESCFMPWKEVGLTPAQFKELMVQVLPTRLALAEQGIDLAAVAPGFAVERTTRNEQGEVVATMQLKSASKSAVSADHFELPKDYERKTGAELQAAPQQKSLFLPPAQQPQQPGPVPAK